MKIPFVKMHAQGNDFIIVETDKTKIVDKLASKLSIDICNRNFGLGADGLVLLNKINPQMIIFNADGSRAEMCGSALRCCCYLIAESSGKQQIQIKTDNGILKGVADKQNPLYVTVEIGKPVMIKNDIVLEGFTGDYITIGNPHFVILEHDLSLQPHLTHGKALSENKYFDHGSNIEFVHIISKNKIEMVVWERGAGATMSCGTGSTAAVFSGQQKKLLDDKVQVHVPGGEVVISKKGNTYYLGGVVSLIARGEFEWTI